MVTIKSVFYSNHANVGLVAVDFLDSQHPRPDHLQGHHLGYIGLGVFPSTLTFGLVRR